MPPIGDGRGQYRKMGHVLVHVGALGLPESWAILPASHMHTLPTSSTGRRDENGPHGVGVILPCAHPTEESHLMAFLPSGQ